jgi:hypothetical protein
MTPHRPTLRSLTLTSGLTPTPNSRICGFAFGYAQICPYGQTSHIPGTLCEITGRLEKFL